MKNQKGAASLYVVIAIVIVALITGYFAFKKSNTQNQSTPQSSSSITVISPNGGEKLVQGTLYSVRWSGGENKSKIGIALYDDFGGMRLGWLTTNGEPKGEFSWDPANYEDYNPNIRVPLKPGHYKLEVGILDSDQSSFCGSAIKYPCRFIASDFSDKSFEVTATDETANWQTYRNEKFGFEFKHPVDLTIYRFQRDNFDVLGSYFLDASQKISAWVGESYGEINYKNPKIVYTSDKNKATIAFRQYEEGNAHRGGDKFVEAVILKGEDRIALIKTVESEKDELLIENIVSSLIFK